MHQERIGAAQLFRQHAPFVAAFLHRLGVEPAEIDDVVQEVFLVAHDKGGYTPGAATPRTWLGAIAIRLARAARRKRGRRREDYDEIALEAAQAEGHDPARALSIAQSMARLQRALDTLDVEHRAVFVLYELEGDGCAEIAAALDVPVGTIYSRLHNARRKFKRAHDALVEEELMIEKRAMEAG